jgi:hypothetical protein
MIYHDNFTGARRGSRASLICACSQAQALGRVFDIFGGDRVVLLIMNPFRFSARIVNYDPSTFVRGGTRASLYWPCSQALGIWLLSSVGTKQVFRW